MIFLITQACEIFASLAQHDMLRHDIDNINSLLDLFDRIRVEPGRFHR